MWRCRHLRATHWTCPGARRDYEVRGSGPTLMLVGHPMGTSGFDPIAPPLAEEFTVVTYDPRGFARSTIDDPNQDAEPDLLADDARRRVGGGRRTARDVFGSSGGAVRPGLALASRYPNHVATLIAHEPPLALLLSESEVGAHRNTRDLRPRPGQRHRRGVASVLFLYRMNMRPQGDHAEPQPPSAEALATSERFFDHGLSTHRSLPAGLHHLASGADPGRGRRGLDLQGPVRSAHSCRACAPPRHPSDRLPRGPCRFRHRVAGVCRHPPPHLGRAGVGITSLNKTRWQGRRGRSRRAASHRHLGRAVLPRPGCWWPEERSPQRRSRMQLPRAAHGGSRRRGPRGQVCGSRAVARCVRWRWP